MAVFTMIGTAIFGAGTFLAGATAMVLKAVAGIGLSLLAQAIAGKPKAPTFSIQTELRAGGDLPRSFILGRYMTAGSRSWCNTWGQDGKTPNAFFTDVISLSDLPSSSLEEVWVDGEKVTLLGPAHPQFGSPVQEYRKDGKDHLWIKFYDGTQTVVDPYLTGVAASADFPYESTRVGRGVTYGIVTALVNQELFNDLPAIKWVIQGAKLYDLTKDSTVGGSGPQRWNDPSTWGGDGDNLPIVQIYNLMRGISYNGSWLFGAQSIRSGRLPPSEWISQINKCRQVVTTPEGTEYQYRSGMEVQVSGPVADAIEELLTACGGRMIHDGVKYYPLCGDPDAPVAVIDDGIILSTEQQVFTPFRTLSDTVNGIAATFPDPSAGWEQSDLPPLLRPDLEAIDGGRRLLTDFQFNTVTSSFQCQRLMDAALRESRRERRHTVTLPPSFYLLRPGHVVTFNSERNSYVGKQFRVEGRMRQPNLDILIDIIEVNPDDYVYDPDDYVEMAPVQIGMSRPPPQPIIDWAAFPYVLRSPTGAELPAILLTWDGDQPDVEKVIYEVREPDAVQPFHTGNVTPVDRGSTVVSQALAPSTPYQVRGRYASENPGRTFEWSAWLNVTTPAMQITGEELGPHSVTIPKFATDAATIFDSQRESIIGKVTEFLDREESQRILRAESQRANAGFNEKITVVVGETAALAEQVTTLTATVDSNMATVQGQITAISDDQSAMADLIDDLTAEINGATANARFRMTAVAAPSGVAARIEAQVRINTGAGWVSGGWALDLVESPPGSGTYVCRFTIYADYIFVTTTGGVNVLFYDAVNNALTMFNGRFIAGYVGDQNGRWRQDMNNAVLKIYDESNVLRVQLGNLSV